MTAAPDANSCSATALPIACNGYSRKDRKFWSQHEIESLLAECYQAQADQRLCQQILRDYTHPTHVRTGKRYYPRVETITRGSICPVDATSEGHEIFRANYYAPNQEELAEALVDLIVPEDTDPDDPDFFDPEDYDPPALKDPNTWEWTHLPDFPDHMFVLVPKGELSAEAAYAKSTDAQYLAALRERNRPRREAANAAWEALRQRKGVQESGGEMLVDMKGNEIRVETLRG